MKRRGRPRVPVSPERVHELVQAKMPYRRIAEQLGISKSTVQRLATAPPEAPEGARSITPPPVIDPAIFGTHSPAILEAR